MYESELVDILVGISERQLYSRTKTSSKRQ